MKKIVISGYYGFGNAGDEAVLAAIIKSLKDIQTDIEITVLSANPEQTISTYRVSAVDRYSLPVIFNTIRNCDLFISGGGSLLQDVTSFRSIPYYLGLVFMAKMFGKKTVWYAQGIGPIRGNIAGKMVKWMGKRVDLVSVRDNHSRKLLSKLGLEVDQIIETVDPVFALASNSKAGKATGAVNFSTFSVNKKGNRSTPIIAVSIRPWHNCESYLLPLARAVDDLAADINASIILVPLNYKQDYKLSVKFNELLSVRADILEKCTDPRLMIDIFSRFDVVVGVRLHSLIFAAINRVPFLGISYDPKIEGFFNKLGLEAPLSVNNCSEEILRQKLKTLWHKRGELSNYLDEKVIQYKKETGLQAARVMDLLN